MAKITFAQETINPTPPSAGQWRLYFMASGAFAINSAGTIVGPLLDATSISTFSGLVTGSYLLLDGRYQGSGTISTDGFVTGSYTLLNGKYQPSGTYSPPYSTTGTVNAGSATTEAVTPYALAHSNAGIRYIGGQILSPATALATGTLMYLPPIPAAMNGMNLVSVQGQISTGTSGKIQLNIFNRTDSVFMLTNPLTFELPKADGYLATGTQMLINTATDDIATHDQLQPVITVVSGTASGLSFTLGFQLP